ncbi:MAG TPA: zinc-dependent metalloprotease [Agriterribacter sp.]|nr:zinc-dependent metalloprotease [Agriterribacter sp.]
MKGLVAVFCFVLLACTKMLAQPVCGFDQSHHALQVADPSYQLRVTLNDQKIETLIQQRKRQANYQKRETAIFTIPIVVHVLHTGQPIGSSFNPDDEQILSAINYLNEIYTGTHPSLTPAGTESAGDLGLRFVLAKRDADCNPTSGIHRVDMSSDADYVATGAHNDDVSRDIEMKAPISWDRSRYYNIYVVNKINGKDGTTGQFIAGYAYFPTLSVVDGTVMLATQMKSGSKTLAHEIGHAFNLYHTFEGSPDRSTCPLGNGDFVDDTDPVTRNVNAVGVFDFTCRTGNNTCINQPYNIRTESNFMSYTNCYTLFTPGQKERLQASVSLQERVSLSLSIGGLATNVAPACVPKINFEWQTAELVKTPVTVDGCRKYQDHLFYFTIGNSPSNDAVATIIIDPSSTAKENADFDFPLGKAVVFPSGSQNSRSFLLRVYDNGSSMETQLLRLSFSVNNGGGNAEKGNAVTYMDITLRPHDYSPVVSGTPALAALGSQAHNLNNATLFNASIQRQKTQILYTANELITAGVSAGDISGIRFYIQKNSTRAFKNLTIKMALTAFNNLVENGNVHAVVNMLTTLSLPSYTTVNGWNIFNFTTPFVWNGSSNIAVEICFDNETTASGNADIIYAYSDGSGAADGSMIESEGIACSSNFSNVAYYQGGIKPIIMLAYSRQGNPVANTISTSREEYLGAFNEVYFYDKLEPQKIIAKIKNLDNWDYGCTTISIDREGNGTVPFWNDDPVQQLTQKTFFVTPQNNNPSGKYEITLYYTKAEKAGYETATGNAWTNVKMIKTERPVASVVPTDPQAGAVEVSPQLVHNSFGEDITVQAIFNSGFSGFSVGAIDAALPVQWLNVSAQNANDNVKLNWSTAMEFNNSYFAIEASADGIHFSGVGKVMSKGNSNSPTYYDYLHPQPGFGKLFYRIKQVDIDGRSSYSKVVMVNIPEKADAHPWIYPVPAGSHITLHFGKPERSAYIEILSSDMKSVYREKIQGTTLTKNIFTGDLRPGTYFIKITGEKSNYILRFVKY